ncbi:hypothetical protein ACF0H5_006451 [Mactra antiquata]
MVFESKCLRCFIIVSCFVALGLNIFGFSSPGWLVLKRTVVEERTSLFQGQLIDRGGMHAPPEVVDDEIEPESLRKKRSEEEIDVVEEEVLEENNVLVDWFQKVTVEIKEYEVKVGYGLWYATLCIHEKDGRHGDSSSSEERGDGKHGKHGKKGHCHCKKISIKCALYNSFIFEDPIDYINPGPLPKHVLSLHSFGYASLVEQRYENCIALALLVVGAISAIGAARKVNGCRCAAVACFFLMLLSALLSLLPVIRFSNYSVFKHKQAIPIHVGVPYSAVASGIAAILCIFVTLAMGCGLAKNKRSEQPGHWYKFNNELELPQEQEEKKPQLVFYTEPLPEKPDSPEI